MDRLTRSAAWTAAALLASAVFAQAAAAQQGEAQPNVTANGDGSCTIHYRMRSDVHIDNGASYHQPEMRGRKSGVIYLHDRTFQCQSGHISVVK